MSQTGGALLGLAVLVAVTHWVWTQVVAHVDPLLIPAGARRRVDRIRANSANVYVASAVVVAGVLCAEGALMLG